MKPAISMIATVFLLTPSEGSRHSDEADRAQATLFIESGHNCRGTETVRCGSIEHALLENLMTNTVALQQLLRDVTDVAISALANSDDRRSAGDREGQYRLDLLVDGPLVQTLLDNGLGVLSEEAGLIEPQRSLLAVVDPVDGSTNASRGVSWFATSICVFDDDGPLVALVENHTTRERFEAVRGGGATRSGEPMGPVTPAPADERIILTNGMPSAERAWAQFRVLGASALDINYVAAGVVDGYIDFDTEAHGVWDYAGALLVCQEVGVPIVDAFGRDLVHRDIDERRTPVVAHDVDALETFVRLRRSVEPGE